MPRGGVTVSRKAAARGRRTTRITRRRAPVAEQDGRERILTAAIREFSELGHAGATTASIARAARVTQPLIHHHFGSKDGLWRAAVDAVFSNLPHVTGASPGASPRETLMEILERFVRFVAAHPEATRIIAREGARPSPRLDYLLKHYLHEPFREVVDVLRGAQTAGLLTAEVRPELALFLFLGAGSHLFDVAALAERTHGIDTTTAWTREAMVLAMRTLVERGLFR